MEGFENAKAREGELRTSIVEIGEIIADVASDVWGGVGKQRERVGQRLTEFGEAVQEGAEDVLDASPDSPRW